jgi:hypothetical protein
MRRGQASLTAIEAALGVLFLLSVVFVFALGPGAVAGDRAQLDAYASDTLTVLETEQPRQAGVTRLDEVVADRDSFEREKDALADRIRRTLPDNVMFRVETAYGTAGYRLPDGVATGTATAMTRRGSLTLRVWYA